MTDLDKYVADEINKYKGVLFPIKASLLERALIRKLPVEKLHPNPEDEFCIPSVGPSYRIINDYVYKFTQSSAFDDDRNDPIVVEKMYPDGYLILNGHHRWAAYMRISRKKVPVTIVNLTHEADIEKMLNEAKGNKRIVMELDDVVFVNPDIVEAEKPVSVLYRNVYKERLRKGIPALFHLFEHEGYDIWVYTSKLYSVEYIRKLFKLYHVKVNGIVTGTGKKNAVDSATKKKLEKMISGRYKYSIFVDNKEFLRVDSETKILDDIQIDADNWAQDIMRIMGELQQDEGKE